MASGNGRQRLLFAVRSILPVVWVLALPYLPLGQWRNVYLWSGIAIVCIQLAWWLKQWKTFSDVMALLRTLTSKKQSNAWSRFRGVVVTQEGEQFATEPKASGPLWSYPIKSGFLTLRMKNGVRMPVRVGRAWAFHPIRNGDRVTVWGYYDKYFKAFWVDKSPILSTSNIRLRAVYWHGLYATITAGHLILLGGGLTQSGLWPHEAVSRLIGGLTLFLLVWLFVYTVMWLVWLATGLKKVMRRFGRQFGVRKHKQA